ncbi:MAG: 6-pyruvoyl tetrahydrobiopterin synthase [Parcubacteria group bacterium]|jgi:6-pyruvoyltetrahydropterin/6-carboxytetrahydropterin synthase|nr:6-pyruvoyl tetrahydrobiopterin synthase [Parcubacteria group bacterium]|tara:strand:+ start:915 stop:1361 length:447 start_codon:yes stop_codon:yes gene_type:complete
MKIITATRRIQFCCGHRVMLHESKCAHLHGHNYVAFFTASAELDAVGRVMDFSAIKTLIGGWIDKYWDHGFILNKADELGIKVVSIFEPREGIVQKLYLMPTNPTAENMAEYLVNTVCPSLMKGTGVEITKVRIWETENCYADAEEDR